MMFKQIQFNYLAIIGNFAKKYFMQQIKLDSIEEAIEEIKQVEEM